MCADEHAITESCVFKKRLLRMSRVWCSQISMAIGPPHSSSSLKSEFQSQEMETEGKSWNKNNVCRASSIGWVLTWALSVLAQFILTGGIKSRLSGSWLSDGNTEAQSGYVMWHRGREWLACLPSSRPPCLHHPLTLAPSRRHLINVSD